MEPSNENLSEGLKRELVLSRARWIFRKAVDLIRQGDIRSLGERIRGRLYSNRRYIVLRRDLTARHLPPESTISIRVAAIEETSVGSPQGPEFPGGPVERQLWRHASRSGRSGRCFVALTVEDQPCYIQWMFTPQDREILSTIAPQWPRLQSDEVLLEGAYTLPAFRRKGIMGRAMSRIAEKGAALGARWALAIVEPANVASIKGCRRAGFEPCFQLAVRHRLFMCFVGRLPVLEEPIS